MRSFGLCLMNALPVVLALVFGQAHAQEQAKVSPVKPDTGAASHEPSPKERALAEAAGFGIVGIMSQTLPTSPTPPLDPALDYFGHKIPESMSAMWHESIDDAAGAPGLRLSSTGSGALAHARWLLTRGVATVGSGDSAFDIDAFDSRAALEERRRREHARPERHTPEEVIQRIIRENFGQMNVCYHQGLRLHRDLRGRVAVKFVIDRHGSVALARDADSDLPDADVVACVVRAFDRLTFPESDDSVVTVVYPLVFTP